MVLSTRRVTFNLGSAFDENDHEFLRPAKGKNYVGEPNAEINENWIKLTPGALPRPIRRRLCLYVLHRRWFPWTEEESREAWGSEYPEFWDEYAGGYLAT
jgi:hypothetical protein